jgi:hypothetical protein
MRQLPRTRFAGNIGDQQYVNGLNMGSYLARLGETLRKDLFGRRMMRALEQLFKPHRVYGGLRVGDTTEIQLGAI